MLERSRDKRTMNLEMLDGFFAALICSPDLVPPSEYLREIWGGDHIGEFRDETEMQEFFDLIMRHWNSLARTFNSSEPFMPFLLEDDAGVAHANDWAQGFTRGMKLRREDGLTSLKTRTMRGCWCRSSRSRTNTILIHDCGRTRSRWMQSGGKSWWWASLRACPASTATFFPDAICRHEQGVAQERTGARARRSDGMILARAGRGRNSRSAAGR